jgi:hypothetical protein
MNVANDILILLTLPCVAVRNCTLECVSVIVLRKS